MPGMVLLVTAASVGVRLGLGQQLDPAVKARIELAIEDAQGKVQDFLNRPLAAREETVTGLYWNETYLQSDKRAWPGVTVSRFDDRYRPKSWTVNPDDPETWDVVFTIGLDVAGDPELTTIKSFIGQDAAEQLRLDPAFTAVARPVSSVSAGGQSVSYERARPVDAAGGGITLASLKRWKRYAMGTARTGPRPPWPYDDLTS